MTKTKSIYLALLAVFLSPMAANAEPIWTLDPVSEYRNNAWSFGQTFTVGSNDILVTGLGAFDAYGDGFVSLEGVPVGIFLESDGSLLASTFVDSSDSLVGNFRFANISTLILLANTQYRVVANNLNDLYNVAQNNWSLDSRIGSMDGYGYCSTTSLTFCDDNSGSTYVWMANVMISDGGVSVPEPGTLALLGLGLVGMAARRKKKV